MAYIPPRGDDAVPVLTITPEGLANRYPCVQCATTSQVLAAMAVVLYAINHAGTFDVNDMIDDANCFRCLTDKQLLDALFNALVAVALANGYFETSAEAIEAAECLMCTDPHTIKAIIVKQTAEYIDGQWPQ